MKLAMLVTFSVAMLGSSFGQCAVPEELTAVQATYRTQMQSAQGSGTRQSVIWKFERGVDYVAVSDMAHKAVELWQRDAGHRLWYRQAFHREKKIVEYQPAELRIGGISDSWKQIASVIDPDKLMPLTYVGAAARVLGQSVELYRGTLNGERIKVGWLPALRIPAYVEKQASNGTSSLRLLSLAAPGPTSTEWATGFDSLVDYESIDFADLGDRDQDPFIGRLIKHEESWFSRSR